MLIWVDFTMVLFLFWTLALPVLVLSHTSSRYTERTQILMRDQVGRLQQALVKKLYDFDFDSFDMTWLQSKAQSKFESSKDFEFDISDFKF